MAPRKPKADVERLPGPPQVQRQLRKLARVEASRMTGVPVSRIKGTRPVAIKKNTIAKKGNKANG